MSRRTILYFVLILLPLLALAEPTTLRVIDLRWIQGQPELETWLGSLQGTLNRQETEAPVFLIRSETDAAWAQALQQTYGLQRQVFTPGALLAAVRPQLTGQVLYDPAQPWSRNVALTAAAVAPGQVIATDADLGLPTVDDFRGKWPNGAAAYPWAIEHLTHASTESYAVAPEDGHLLADLIAAKRLLAVDPAHGADQWQAALQQHCPRACVYGAVAALGEIPPGERRVRVRDLPNLSCFLRFPATRPLLQGQNDVRVTTDRERNLVLVYGHPYPPLQWSFFSLDYAATTVFTLLHDPDLADLPVGVMAPRELREAVPALYQILLARQRLTAAELVNDMVSPDSAQFFMTTLPALRLRLKELTGPFNVLYLDPRGIPPAALQALRGEIEENFNLLTPGQAVRAKAEFDAVTAWEEAQAAQGVKQPARAKATLQPGTPTTTTTAPTPGDAIPVRVRVTGDAQILTQHLIYRAPDGRRGTADLVKQADGSWAGTLPPMLTGGTVSVRARFVELPGCGISYSPPLTLTLPVVDGDQDGADDTLETYIGSDPKTRDTDGDGLADGLDGDPLTVDRDLATYVPPIVPPHDTVFLTEAGTSTADAHGRTVPAGTAVTYTLPLRDLPAAPAALRISTRGSGTIAINGSPTFALEDAPASFATTEAFLAAAVLGGKTLAVTLTAGTHPLVVDSLSLVSNPKGPYLRSVTLTPAIPPAEMPIAVRALVYDPDGVKTVRLRYGYRLTEMRTVELTPAEGLGGVVFTGEIPKRSDGMTLLYAVEAEDTAGNLAVGAYHMVPIGRTTKHSVSLIGGRELQGEWQPTPIWGGLGRSLTDRLGTDHDFTLVRPGRYVAWLLAHPWERGINVRIEHRPAYTNTVREMLKTTVPAGSPGGWYRLGVFSVDEAIRLHVYVSPVGEQGYCAYGTILLTQNDSFTPPIAHRSLDWHNTLTLSGVKEGEQIGDTVTVTVRPTGNIDSVEVVAYQINSEGGIRGDTLRLTPLGKDRYTLDARRLPPGTYVIKATGLRLLTEGGQTSADPLLDIRVTVRK